MRKLEDNFEECDLDDRDYSFEREDFLSEFKRYVLGKIDERPYLKIGAGIGVVVLAGVIATKYFEG